MWDYDKLFAEGNVVGIKNIKTGKTIVESIDDNSTKEFYIEDYGTKTLAYPISNEVIQYIIRLDEHGNVIEKLFDRERDMVEPMPKLETGMFVRVAGYDDSGSLGFIDVENNHIIYQSGGYDYIKDKLCSEGVMHNIIEVYDKSALCFDGCCSKNHLIWKDPKYKVHS